MASRSAFSKLSRLSIFNSNNLTLPTQCRALTPYSSPVLKSSHHQPLISTTSRHFSLSSINHKDKKPEEKKEENLSLGKKFKKMFKDYSYVLVPVHVATSVVWYGSFYLLVKSGVDVPACLAYLGTPETYLEKLRGSEYVDLLLAYACYKVATPARYTVTITGTTYTVKYLSDQGYLKTASQVGDDIKEKSEEIRDNIKEVKSNIKEKSHEVKSSLKEKSHEVKSNIKERTSEIREKFDDEWEQAWKKYAARKRWAEKKLKKKSK